jgi:hypothetical protein
MDALFAAADLQTAKFSYRSKHFARLLYRAAYAAHSLAALGASPAAVALSAQLASLVELVVLVVNSHLRRRSTIRDMRPKLQVLMRIASELEDVAFKLLCVARCWASMHYDTCLLPTAPAPSPTWKQVGCGKPMPVRTCRRHLAGTCSCCDNGCNRHHAEYMDPEEPLPPVVARAALLLGGSRMEPALHNRFSGGVPCPYLGDSGYVSSVTSQPDLAAAGLATSLGSSAVALYSRGPLADGQVVTFVAPDCDPSEASLTPSAAPIRPRHGWSASGPDLQQVGRRHAQVSRAILLLGKGQLVSDLSFPPGSAGHIFQATDNAWAVLQAWAAQLGLPQALLPKISLVASTLAGVAVQLKLLPPADADGLPSLGLSATNVAVALATGSPQAAAGLAGVSTPADAWASVQENGGRDMGLVIAEAMAQRWLLTGPQRSARWPWRCLPPQRR